MRRRWALASALALLCGCSSLAHQPPVPRHVCPDRGEGIRVEVSGRFRSDGHYLIVPCTVANRLSGHVHRIRYIHGFFNEMTDPTLLEIRRGERQMDLSLAPAEVKEVTFEIDMRNEATILNKEGQPLCFGIRAVPFDLDGTPLPQEDAWVHEH